MLASEFPFFVLHLTGGTEKQLLCLARILIRFYNEMIFFPRDVSPNEHLSST